MAAKIGMQKRFHDLRSYTWAILQPCQEKKNLELKKEVKMTTMQTREIRKPIDEEIDILSWLAVSRLNFPIQVHHYNFCSDNNSHHKM